MQTESETSIAQNARPLATQPLGRLMRRYAVPCMTSLVVAALYNMVDQVFIANAPDLGSVGNAATTVVFPLTVAAQTNGRLACVLDGEPAECRIRDGRLVVVLAQDGFRMIFTSACFIVGLS